MEYQKVVREIEHLNRLYVAYQFTIAEETKLHSADVLKEMESSISKLQEEMTENEKKVKELSKEISEMEKKRDQVRLVQLLFYNMLIQVVKLIFSHFIKIIGCPHGEIMEK